MPDTRSSPARSRVDALPVLDASSTAVGELATKDEPIEQVAEHGLADHLRAAIRQNVARRADYRRRGGWRAWSLSVVLVGHERSLLPVAALLDRQARRFQRQGIPVVVADLQPIALSPPSGRQLDGVGPMRWADLQSVGERLRTAARATRRALRRSDLAGAACELAWALDAIEAVEAKTGGRLALTAHVLESSGVSALNGIGHVEASGGRAIGVVRRFVAGQTLLLPGALALDALAGPVHARGVPLFIDDVPPVPFRNALRQFLDSSPVSSCDRRTPTKTGRGL